MYMMGSILVFRNNDYKYLIKNLPLYTSVFGCRRESL